MINEKIQTTANGYEITHSSEQMDAQDFRERMASEYGITGDSPRERIEQLQNLSVEGVSIMWTDINKSLQGSRDSLMNRERVMKIGDTETIPLEDRYAVFSHLVESIKDAPKDTSPERIADVMALGLVLLHPFHDGNGRTARVLGMLFRENYDAPDYERDYNTITESRDAVRDRGGLLIYGYTPRFPEGFDQSDASAVSLYLDTLLHEEQEGAYLSCFGQAPLH